MTCCLQHPPARSSSWIFRLGKQLARYRGAHENAFLDFADVPHEALYDNMRMVVLERHGRPVTDFELKLQWPPSTYSRIVIFIEVSQLNFT
jgi:hypothetical protein